MPSGVSMTMVLSIGYTPWFRYSAEHQQAHHEVGSCYSVAIDLIDVDRGELEELLELRVRTMTTIRALLPCQLVADAEATRRERVRLAADERLDDLGLALRRHRERDAGN